MFINDLEIECVIASWKANEAIYKHTKAQYLNMNKLYTMAYQTCCFLQIYMGLRPSTPYSLKLLVQPHISFDKNIQ